MSILKNKLKKATQRFFNVYSIFESGITFLCFRIEWKQAFYYLTFEVTGKMFDRHFGKGLQLFRMENEFHLFMKMTIKQRQEEENFEMKECYAQEFKNGKTYSREEFEQLLKDNLKETKPKPKKTKKSIKKKLPKVDTNRIMEYSEGTPKKRKK